MVEIKMSDIEYVLQGRTCIVRHDSFINTAKAVRKFNSACVGMTTSEIYDEMISVASNWLYRKEDFKPGYAATMGFVISACELDNGTIYFYASVWHELFSHLEVV